MLVQEQQNEGVGGYGAGRGLWLGLRSFSGSLMDGLLGLLQRPLREIRESDASLGWALAKGVSKGIVGAVAKPLSGAFDLVSHASHGFANAVAPSSGSASAVASISISSSFWLDQFRSLRRRCDPVLFNTSHVGHDSLPSSVASLVSPEQNASSSGGAFDPLDLSHHHCALLGTSSSGYSGHSNDSMTTAEDNLFDQNANTHEYRQAPLSAASIAAPASCRNDAVSYHSPSYTDNVADDVNELPLRLYRSLSLASFACSAVPRYRMIMTRMDELYLDHIAGCCACLLFCLPLAEMLSLCAAVQPTCFSLFFFFHSSVSFYCASKVF